MTQLGEAIARYNKLLQTAPYPRLDWAEDLQQRMMKLNLRRGMNPICTFIRPHFITRRQYAALAKTAELLGSAIHRILDAALSDPALMARLALLPGEKMLAGIEPGYPGFTPTSYFDTFLYNGGLRVMAHHWDSAPYIAMASGLADLFYDCPPVRHFRRYYRLTKLGGAKELISALLATYKQFGGKRRPHVGILQLRTVFKTTGNAETLLLLDLCRQHGLAAEIVFPEEVEYRKGVLRQGEFPIDLLWRRVRVHDFLVHFDLTHPVIRACQDRAVCMVSSFRAEMAQKRTVLCLLSDETVTAKFPAAERKAIQNCVPWTRLIVPGQTRYKDQTVDLLDFVVQNRENLVLMSNDPDLDQHVFDGRDTNPGTWERVLKHASQTPIIVQERVEPVRELFPVYRFREMGMRKVIVDVQPHSLAGKVQTCTTWLREESELAFSSLTGSVPTFILETKS